MKFWRYILPLLILALAFGLRLYRLDFQSIWWDEGHSIFVAGYPISQIPTLPAMDVHPPAYFALLHLWMNLTGSSEFGLRYLSVVFSLLTVALLWRFAASISNYVAPARSGRSTAGLASLLAALSPMYVAYAQEVRSYAMITCLALVSTFVLWRILFSWPNSTRGRWTVAIAYILSTAASLYTHYFTIFLLLFQNLAWLGWILSSKRPALPRSQKARPFLWLAGQAGILLLFAPQLLLALRQVTGYTNPNLTPPSLTHFIHHSWQAYTVGLTIDPALARWGVWGIAASLSISWLILFIRKPKLSPSNSRSVFYHFLFLSGWFFLPLAAYFFILQGQPSFEPRYMMLVTPALFLLLALGIDLLPRPLRFTLALLSLAIFVLALYSYYTDQTYFKDDSRGVADWLAAETTPDDIVYIDVPHPFHYYVAQQKISAPTRYLFVDIHTAADTLTEEAGRKDRLFWVTWRGSDTDPRGVIPFLAQKFGEQLGRRDFRGYQVTWFDLPDQDTRFSLPTALPRLEATFGDLLRLDGAAHSKAVQPGRSVWVTLHFSLLRDTEVDYRVSLRLLDEAGQVVSQLDKDLLNDRHFRTSAWPVADPALNQAINVYILPTDPDLPPGSYRLEVVLYNARPPYPSEGVTGPAANRDGVAAKLGNITVLP